MSLSGQYRPPFRDTPHRRGAPLALLLGGDLAPLTRRAATPLELAAMLDTLGYDDLYVRQTYGLRDTFMLAEQVWAAALPEDRRPVPTLWGLTLRWRLPRSLWPLPFGRPTGARPGPLEAP